MVAQVDKKYIDYGYLKVLRRFISYLFFEGRPHSTKGQWFNPVVFFILTIINYIPFVPKVVKPIFVTGMGRSGTTVLGKILSLHDDVGFLNEPKAIWSVIEPKHDVNGDYINADGKFFLDKADVNNSSRLCAYKLFGFYLKMINSGRIVDKYPELIFRIGYLIDIFPDAKIIFIIRNGVDAVHSIENWSKNQGVTSSKGVEDWWGRNDIKWRYLCEQILSIDPYYKDLSELITMDLDHLNRAALEWIVTMRVGFYQCEQFSGRIYKIRYEDLVDFPDSELSHLFNFCELERSCDVFSYAKSTLYNINTKDYPVLNNKVDILFKDTMKKLGYPVLN